MYGYEREVAHVIIDTVNNEVVRGTNGDVFWGKTTSVNRVIVHTNNWYNHHLEAFLMLSGNYHVFQNEKLAQKVYNKLQADWIVANKHLPWGKKDTDALYQSQERDHLSRCSDDLRNATSHSTFDGLHFDDWRELPENKAKVQTRFKMALFQGMTADIL